jgi:hypothetical protein
MKLSQRSILRSTVVLACLVAETFSIVPKASAAGIYSFTTAGVTGKNGPTQAQITSAYSATNLAGLVTISTQGIQQWTVPTTGNYTIEVAGASGGSTPNATGGKGRLIKTQISLTAGKVLKILVGQVGGQIQSSSSGAYAAGGGGGSFIVNTTDSTLLVAAGGGGGGAEGVGGSNASVQNGVDAAAYTSTAGLTGTGFVNSWSAAGAGGTNGNGGAGSSGGGAGGGGYLTSGTAGTYGGGAGTSFATGAVGGSNNPGGASTNINTEGGFGGGGGAGIYPNFEADSGGGGGYSGGGGGASRVGAGGGGGNYYTGTFISSGLNTGDGHVTISLIAPASISVTTPALGIYRSLTQLTSVSDSPGKVTFYAAGKAIPGCKGIVNSGSGSTYTAICNWKPSVHGTQTITVSIAPTNGNLGATTSAPTIGTAARANNR